MTTEIEKLRDDLDEGVIGLAATFGHDQTLAKERERAMASLLRIEEAARAHLSVLETTDEDRRMCDLALDPYLSKPEMSSPIELAALGGLVRLFGKTIRAALSTPAGLPVPEKLPQNVVDFVHEQRRKAERTGQTVFIQDIWSMCLRALSIQPKPPVAEVSALPVLPKRCDGKEQWAFEEWAKGEKYDMKTHPLHWLFLDAKTYAARQGWVAALNYVNAKINGGK